MPGTEQKIILLVEDEAVIAMTEQKQLEKEGYRVILASSGEKALDIICVKKEAVDLVLMDIDLGKGMDGTEVAQKMLDDHDIPVLFLSSHIEKEIVTKTEKITNYGYVVKDSSFTVLDASIKMAFKLFDAKQDAREQRFRIEAACEEMQASNESLTVTATELKLSEAKYKNLISKMMNAFGLHEMIFDEKGEPFDYRILEVNTAWEEIVGMDADAVIGKTIREVMPDIEDSWIQRYGRVVKTGVSDEFEDYNKATGKDYRAYAYRPEPGQFAVFFNDITERKRTEKILRKTKDELERFFDIVPVMVATATEDGCFKDVNAAWMEVLGFRKDELVSKSVFGFIHPDDITATTEEIERQRSGQSTMRFVNRYRCKDGTYRHLEWDATPAIDGTMFAAARDVTERIVADEKIRTLLSEKELVLAEAHHRIKNNMGSMISLLKLQADAGETPEAKNALTDAAGRLQSMMVLYNKLYRSDYSGKLSLNEYIPSLIEKINTVFPAPVKMELEIEDIAVDAKRLSSVGIILNELVNNTMKYAFTDIESGSISVAASQKDNGVSLIYKDNGVGLPETVSFEDSSGFGMQLVGMLMQQLDGTISIERGSGTHIIMEFDV